MITKEILKQHYKEYSERLIEHVEKRASIKKFIVGFVLNKVQFASISTPVKIVVLGASDKRYIPIHKKIFEEIIKRKISIFTFDIDEKHLSGEDGVVKHDVTKTFPDSFDIIFSHELMKFLEEKEQIQVLKNSYESLNKKGLAIHIIHSPSLFGTTELKHWQYRVNPTQLVEELKKSGIPIEIISFDDNKSKEWFGETKVIVTKKS